MYRRLGLVFLSALLFAPLANSAWPQNLSSQPQPAAKVCVAIVANRTTKLLFPERMTARLTQDLVKNKLAAVTMGSATTNDRELHPTMKNSEELKSRECDYLLLTHITEPMTNLGELRSPNISIGGRTPSMDASDPMGGSSGPVYRDNLEVGFALFRPGHLNADLDTTLLAQPSANMSDSLMPAMDRVANRISRELKEK
jgi:hypothetical protein